VNRNPTDGQRQAICSQGAFAGSPAACLSSAIGAIADLRTLNTATLTTGGLDMNGAYTWTSAWGELEADLSGTYVFDFSAAATADHPSSNCVTPTTIQSTCASGPLCSGSFRDCPHCLPSTTRTTIAIQSVFPIGMSPRGPRSTCRPHTKLTLPNASWLDETQIMLTATNLLDRDPPFVNNELGVGYDLLNGNLRGRALGLTVRRQW